MILAAILGGVALALLGMVGIADPDVPPGEAIISAIEHHSVTAVAELLERRGWTIHRLGVTCDGVVDPAALDGWLNERTRFVSVMLANNETGVIQPVAEIARRCGHLVSSFLRELGLSFQRLID